tara:strand:+ start:144 stop:437 length:294 start_codon:yes stop_codon:yes gene_type:complete
MSTELQDLSKGQAIVVRVASPHIEIIDIPNDDTLGFFQRYVGGFIEPLSFTFKGKVMTAIINEEGLIRNLKYNELASHYINSPIVGDVVIINPQDLK